MINPNINQTSKDVWIPVSDYVGAFIEIGDYPGHGYYTLKTPSGTETYYENNVLTTAGTSIASNTIWGNNSAWVSNTNIYYTKDNDNTTPIYTSGTTDLNTVTELLPISTFGSWNTHNQTAINAGGRLPTRAEIIALLNGDTTNNHLINPNVDPNTKDVWIPVSDYVGAIVEIGDYQHTPSFYKMSTPNGGETYSEGTTGTYGATVDTVLNLDVQWAPKTNIYYTKVAISSDISGTATDYDSSSIVLKYYMVSSGGSTETPGTIDTTNLKLWFLFNDDLVEKITNTTYTLTQGTPNYIAGKFDKGLNIIDDTKLNILNHTDIIVEGQTELSFSFWLNNLDQNVRDQTLFRYRPTNILLRYSSQYETIGTFGITLEGGSMTKVIGNITSWSHFGFIFNGDTWNIYINGIDDTSNWTNNSSTTTLDDGFTNDNNTFGLFYNDAAGGMEYFRSSIEDFRIYDKALTAQEISDIYNDTEPLVGGSSSSTTSGTIDTTNMLVWYKFDDAANIGLDSSGNGKNGTGANVSIDNTNKIRGTSSVSFNNGNITRDFNIYNYISNGFTVSFWYKIAIANSQPYPAFLTFTNPADFSKKIYMGASFPTSNTSACYVYFDDGNELKEILFGENTVNDQWHHLIWVYKPDGEWNIYIDNVKDSRTQTVQITDVNFTKMSIGYMDESRNNGRFNGNIDDFRIYDKALTAQEISDIYNDTEPLVGGSGSSTETTTDYTPIQRVFLKYTTIVKTIEPSIVDIVYLHPVNTTPILITNDEYYVEIKSTNIIYLPKTYANAEILIIGSTKYVKYENVSLNEFATITIDNDQTTISVNNNNYDLTSGTTIDTALTTELNTYNITEHNNITKVLIKYTTNATTKVTNVVFKDQEYLNVLDYATSLQITNNNITYNENDLKISSNVVNDFDNYFTETIQATNEYGTSSLDYNFIKLGYDGVIVPNLENVSKDIYILNTIANIDLREIAGGKKYELIFNPYYFENNIELIDTTLTLTTNMRGIYDILVSIDNKLYVLRIHEFINELENSFYI